MGTVARVGMAIFLGWPVYTACCQAVDEYKMKAAFIYNFTKFVDWPPQAFRTPTEPVVICILGENPFGDGLDRLVSAKSVDGRSFVVRQISKEQQAAGCHILFICSSERKRIPSIMAAVGSRATLTIGETEGFALQGGVINFKIEEGRVRLQVNIRAAEKAGLHISSKLLTLAQIVGANREPVKP
jgi:hypothetical protein